MQCPQFMQQWASSLIQERQQQRIEHHRARRSAVAAGAHDCAEAHDVQARQRAVTPPPQFHVEYRPRWVHADVAEANLPEVDRAQIDRVAPIEHVDGSALAAEARERAAARANTRRVDDDGSGEEEAPLDAEAEQARAQRREAAERMAALRATRVRSTSASRSDVRCRAT